MKRTACFLAYFFLGIFGSNGSTLRRRPAGRNGHTEQMARWLELAPKPTSETESGQSQASEDEKRDELRSNVKYLALAMISYAAMRFPPRKWRI